MKSAECGVQSESATSLRRWLQGGVLALALAMAGCAGMQFGRTTSVIGATAVDLGATRHLRAHPEDWVIFAAALQGLEGLASTNNFDPAAFAAVLRQLPVDEFNGPDGDLYVSAVVAVWSAAVQDAVSINDVEAVRNLFGPVLQGLRNAVQRTKPVAALKRERVEGLKGEG